MRSQVERAAAFRALHEGPPFVVPNPWDVGSARVLEAMDSRQATTSSGFAFTLGQLDGNVTLDEVVSPVSGLTQATDLPVSVDLENGYGATSERPARAIVRVAEEAGAIGGSIEDWDPSGHLYDKGHAAERIRGRRRGGARAPVPLHADRAGGEPHPRPPGSRRHDRSPPDVEASGADVLYAPGLRTREEVRGRLSGGLPAGERARAAGHVDDRDRRGGCPARERRRWSHLGRGRRDGRRGDRHP